MCSKNLGSSISALAIASVSVFTLSVSKFKIPSPAMGISSFVLPDAICACFDVNVVESKGWDFFVSTSMSLEVLFVGISPFVGIVLYIDLHEHRTALYHCV